MQMNMILKEHPLRTIILEFDEDKVAPAFETKALETYYEMHDRVHTWLERLAEARVNVPELQFQIEYVEEVFEEARRKLEHLLVMIPTNPERPRVRLQFKMFTEELDRKLSVFVPNLIEESSNYYEYDLFSIDEDTWLNDVAFKQFRAIFDDYHNCKVDLVSFDRDFDDFKGSLGHIRNREGKYYDAMNTLIDGFTDLNEKIDALYERAFEYDEHLLS